MMADQNCIQDRQKKEEKLHFTGFGAFSKQAGRLGDGFRFWPQRWPLTHRTKLLLALGPERGLQPASGGPAVGSNQQAFHDFDFSPFFSLLFLFWLTSTNSNQETSSTARAGPPAAFGVEGRLKGGHCDILTTTRPNRGTGGIGRGEERLLSTWREIRV